MKNLDNLLLLVATLFLFCLQNVLSLECYACYNQDSNIDKCVKTTKQCEEHQDICMTKIKWGLPPYWTPYGDRMHYIDKDCAVKTTCNADQADINPRYCKRDWYDDWSCVDCCSGDLCNYYVVLAAGSIKMSVVLTLLSLGLVWAAGRIYT